MSKLRTVGHRVYQDVLMRSRLDDYRALIESLQARGFRFVSMLEFANIVRDPNASTESLCVIRNDVDSGLRTARAMFEIDRSLGDLRLQVGVPDLAGGRSAGGRGARSRSTGRSGRPAR